MAGYVCECFPPASVESAGVLGSGGLFGLGVWLGLLPQVWPEPRLPHLQVDHWAVAIFSLRFVKHKLQYLLLFHQWALLWLGITLQYGMLMIFSRVDVMSCTTELYAVNGQS